MSTSIYSAMTNPSAGRLSTHFTSAIMVDPPGTGSAKRRGMLHRLEMEEGSCTTQTRTELNAHAWIDCEHTHNRKNLGTTPLTSSYKRGRWIDHHRPRRYPWSMIEAWFPLGLKWRKVCHRIYLTVHSRSIIRVRYLKIWLWKWKGLHWRPTRDTAYPVPVPDASSWLQNSLVQCIQCHIH